MSTFKRIMSFVLALVIIMGMLPARAVATETEPTAVEESIPETIPEEITVPDEITVEPVPTELVEEEVAETAAAEDTGDISQEAFEEFLATCDGSYELTRKLTLVKDLEISGVALTLNGGGQIVVSSGTKLILAEDSSLTLNEGQVTVEAGGKLIAFGSVKGSITGEGDFLLTQRNRGTLTVSGQGMISDGDLDYPGTTSSLFIQEGITGIGARAFDGWKLCEVFLPKSLAFIGAQAFAARFLEGVEFKGDVPVLEDPASIFEGTSLLTVFYPSENATWTAEVRESFGPHVNWLEYDLGLVASGKCGDNLTWKLLDTGRLTISGKGAMKNFNLNKLDTEMPWYSRRKKITAVVVKDGVTGIGDYAFDGCINLADVTLPEGLTYIGESAFSGCSALKAITIPSGVARIGRFAFASCSELETVILSPGVKEISEYAFDCCGKIKDLVIPETVTRIGPMAFYFAEALETLEIQGGDTVLERDAFRRCPALETLVLGDGVKEIGPGVFSECTSLKSVEIPGTVELVGKDAFNPCENLETVVFRDGARAIGAIGQRVFGNCKNLRSVIIGEGIREIGEQAFVQARNLKEVVLPKSLKRIDSQAFDVCTSLTEIVIPGGVEYIGECAFAYSKNLKKITFTGGPPTIHEEAFGYDNSKETMVVATAYYPKDAGWTKDNLKNYGGRLTWVADKTQHEHIPVVDPAVAPDCITTGRTEGSYCSVCGIVLVAQQIIPAAGHHFANGACTNCGKTDNGTCGSNVRWALDNGILTVYGKGAMYNFVNDTVPWKNYRDNITGVVINDGVTRIGDYAFWVLPNLTQVQIPNSVTYIGDYAFYSASFAAVTLPENLTGIGRFAFSRCKNMTAVELPESLTSIGGGAFYWCQSLEQVNIPSGVVKIEPYTFSNCTVLKNIVLSSGLQEIGDQAFYECDSLKEIVIPDTVTHIGANAFSNLNALESVEILGPIESMGDLAFAKCHKLKNISFASGTRTIGDRAFENASALMNVKLPDTLEYIGVTAFYGCEVLESIDIPESVREIGNAAFMNCFMLKSITLPKGLTTLNDSVFVGCESLKQVEIPDRVETIGEDTFRYCRSLISIVIPGSVRSIGKCAFFYNGKLRTITFTGEAPEIDEQAFGNPEEIGSQVTATVYYPGDATWTKEKRQNYGGKLKWVVDKTLHTHDPVIDPAVDPTCTETGLTEGSHCAICDEVLVAQQVIPALGHTEVIDEAVAPDCVNTGLTEGSHCDVCGEILVEQQILPTGDHAYRDGFCTGCGEADGGACGDNTRWVFDNGTLTIYGTGAMEDGIGPWGDFCDDITAVVVQEGVTAIGTDAFYGCTRLKNVTLPASLTQIGDMAFEMCENLTEITVPDNVVSIGDDAFRGCTQLETVSLPESLKTIGYGAFRESTKLKEITIPKNVVSLGEAAFAECTGLELIHISNGVTEIKDSTFSFCTSLKSIRLPGSVTRIGVQAFDNCTALETVVAETGLAVIDDHAFELCENLVSVTIPDTVVSIGEQAFCDCVSLKTIAVFEDSSVADVAVPEGITSLGKNCFRECTNLESVTLPRGIIAIPDIAFRNCEKLHTFIMRGDIRSIGEAAFENCKALKTFQVGINTEPQVIPGTLETIGARAFNDCKLLRLHVQIPEGMTEIGESTFKNTKLQTVTIPASVKIIGKSAFSGCTKLEGVVIPGTVEVIGEEAFYYCYEMKTLLLEEGIREIKRNAFGCCESLRTLEIPGTVEHLDKDAFQGCAYVITLVVHEGVRSIGEWTFAHFYYVSSVTLPDSLERIGARAFYNALYLKEIVIPKNVEYIGEAAFWGCGTLKKVYFCGKAPVIDEMFGDPYANPNDPVRVVTATIYYPGDESWTEDKLQDYGGKLTWVVDRCLDGHNVITEPGIAPGCITTGLTEGSHCGDCGAILVAQEVLPALGHTEVIDPAVAPDCANTGLTEGSHCGTCGEILVEQQVLPAGDHHFRSGVCTGCGKDGKGICSENVYWMLDNTTLTISGKGVIDDCDEQGVPWYRYRDSITEVVVMDGITRIGRNAFYNMRNLTKVQLPDSVTYIGEYAFSRAAFKEVKLPANLTGIGDGAFHSCEALESIDIPDSVTEIDICAFERCVALKTVKLPSGLEKIGNQAFSDLTVLESITFPVGLKEIGSAAFAGCYALKCVMIPKTVTSIGSFAFNDCSALEYVEIWGDHAVIGDHAFPGLLSLKTLVIGEGVAEIGNRAFEGCLALKSVEIPGTVQRIGEAAFSSSLETLIFHNGLKIIDKWAFANCKKLTEITLPNTLEAIGKEAFNGCVGLKKVFFTGPAPNIDAHAFGDNEAPYVNAKAYYPGDESWTEDKLQDYGGKLTWVVDRCLDGHDAVTDPVVEPGCVLSGLTEGSHCTDCGEILVTQEMIPATRHDFVNGVCLNCGGEDKADYVLFSGKTMTLQEINPATGKAYTAKEIKWTLSEGGEAYATLAANGKLTATGVFESARVEATATMDQGLRQVIRTVDIVPSVTGLNVLREGETVNGKTVNMGFTDGPVTLTAQTLPGNLPEAVTWTVSDTKGQYAEYTIDGSSLTIENPTGKAGTVTIKAAIDAGVKKNVTVKVSFGGFAKTVEISEPEKTTLKGGESLTLTAAITEPDVISKPGIVWSISDKTVATVSGGKVKAKNVANPTWVTVTATSKDGMASDSVELRILPKNEGQLVLIAGEAFVTNANKVLDKGEELWLSAAVITEGVPVPVEAAWTSSKAAVASVDETGMVVANSNGTAKITAQVGTMKALVNVKVSTLAKTVEITTKDGKNLDDEGNVIVASGKNVALVANIQPKEAAKAVIWEIVEGSQYAKVSNGKVTATKNLTEIRYAAVKATAKDGSDVSGTIWVKILPLATGIQLYREGKAVRAGSTYIHDMMTTDVLNLSAKVYPIQASKAVELTSSSKKIADFNEEGQLVCYKPGTVTITAKALDGSNKKVSFKLTIVKKIQRLTLKNGEALSVIGGKTLKLAPMVEINPTDATNKKLTWSVAPNEYGIKISTSGVLSTKKVAEPVTINVMVTTQDGSGQMLSFDVTVNPN